MKRPGIFTAVVASAMLVVCTGAEAKPPDTWDGLTLVKSKKFDLVYLQPGADFRTYTKVMLDPTEVAFQKNWQRDYNRSSMSLSGRVSDREMQDALTKGVKAATDIFSDAWTKGGYAVVDTPGPDVLRVKTGVLNISVTSPDTQTAGISHTFSEDAGQATLVVEARDSMTGALLGRAIDQKIVGDSMVTWRTSSSNRSDFRYQVEQWATASVRGLSELKSLSPINP